MHVINVIQNTEPKKKMIDMKRTKDSDLVSGITFLIPLKSTRVIESKIISRAPETN